jgi:CRISPR/Cas system-associated endonuclease/helicase Cas3
MGDGKTEAAMMAAEVLAARSGAGGVMIALPTQATSDAMFRRMMEWIEHQPAVEPEGSVVPDGGEPDDRRSVFLAHGKAWLNPDFRAVPRGRSLARDMDSDSDDRAKTRGKCVDHGAYVDQWMTGRRKGVLADFVVGTIDQVLFVSLQSRHVALRHLALARKVVILDEVHSFDAYMDVYLERALEWLGSYGVPVIALSATLPSELRKRLLDAYQRGAKTLRPPEKRTRRGWSAPWPTSRRAPRWTRSRNCRAGSNGIRRTPICRGWPRNGFWRGSSSIFRRCAI